MPKRLARNPSTRSLKPAARNRAKAIRVSPDVIAQRITGTARMRASVIRLGMLKPSPRPKNVPLELRLARSSPRGDPVLDSRLRGNERSVWLDLNETSTECTVIVDSARRIPNPEYSGAQAIAQGAIVPYHAPPKPEDPMADKGRNGLTYADAGVDIDAGNRMVDLIKPLVRATARPGADAEIGGFGGLFDLKRAGFRDPVLVAGTDGVGTKLVIAIEVGKHDTIGIDL